MNTSPGTSGPATIALRRDEGEALWFLDFLATIKSSAATTGGRVAVIEHLAGQDAGSPLHVHHREDEWFYVLDGELTIWVDGQVIPAPAGSFVYGPRNTPHTFTVSSPEGARFLLVAERPDSKASCAPSPSQREPSPCHRPPATPARPPTRRSWLPSPPNTASTYSGPQASRAESRTSQPGKVRDGAPPGPTRAAVTAATREHRLTTH